MGHSGTDEIISIYCVKIKAWLGSVRILDGRPRLPGETHRVDVEHESEGTTLRCGFGIENMRLPVGESFHDAGASC